MFKATYVRIRQTETGFETDEQYRRDGKPVNTITRHSLDRETAEDVHAWIHLLTVGVDCPPDKKPHQFAFSRPSDLDVWYGPYLIGNQSK